MFKDHYFINIFHHTELRIIGKILEKKSNSTVAQDLMLVKREGRYLVIVSVSSHQDGLEKQQCTFRHTYI